MVFGTSTLCKICVFGSELPILVVCLKRSCYKFQSLRGASLALLQFYIYCGWQCLCYRLPWQCLGLNGMIILGYDYFGLEARVNFLVLTIRLEEV